MSFWRAGGIRTRNLLLTPHKLQRGVQSAREGKPGTRSPLLVRYSIAVKLHCVRDVTHQLKAWRSRNVLASCTQAEYRCVTPAGSTVSTRRHLEARLTACRGWCVGRPATPALSGLPA